MNTRKGKTTGTVQQAVLAALGLSLLGVGAAAAAPITTSWSYDFSSAFNTAATVFSSGSGNTTNTTTRLAWGDTQPQNQSSLVINPATATGESAMTYQGIGTVPSMYISDPGILLTHNNFPISSNSHSLKKASLQNTITLTSEAPPPPGSPLSPLTLSFGINFDETLNDYPCAVNPTNPRNPCPDIFVIDQSSLNQSFTYAGNNYFLSVFPLDSSGNLGILPNAACHDAGAANGCFGFVTQENSSNPLNFGLTISTSPFVISAPEPGELGLLGLGGLLLGLGVYRRRKEPRRS